MDLERARLVVIVDTIALLQRGKPMEITIQRWYLERRERERESFQDPSRIEEERSLDGGTYGRERGLAPPLDGGDGRLTVRSRDPKIRICAGGTRL